jgi:hypothetical protein
VITDNEKTVNALKWALREDGPPWVGF